MGIIMMSATDIMASPIKSQLIVGLPILQDLLRQNSLKRFRSHLMSVSGFTMTNVDFHLDHNLDSQTQKIRSIFLIFGFFTLCW